MIRFLSRVPRWLSVSVALVSAVALYVISPGGLDGGKLTISLALGAMFTASAVGLPLLDRWQSKQEARLSVHVTMEPPDLTIPVYTDDEKFIESLVAAESAACLASVPSQRPTRRTGGFDAAMVHEAADVRQARQELDLQLQEFVDSTHETIASAVAGLSNSFTASMLGLSRPETRTVEEYQREVERHLAHYAEFLNEHLLWKYVERNIGLLRLTLVNSTDRVFENVLVELYVPGLVKAMEPDDVSGPASSPPARPRPFGTASPNFDFDLNTIIPRQFVTPSPASYPAPRGPMIDNSGSARVTYQAVLLRARARKHLDDIVLIVNEPPGSVITGTWEATATNAEGRIHGDLAVKVATTPLQAGDLLASVAAGRA